MFKLNRANLAALNTLTKYPSIATYHPLGEKGRLLPDPNPLPEGKALYVTEKIDGTNVRMVFLHSGDVLLGSRENLLWKNGDFFGDPAQGIVAALRDEAERLAPKACQPLLDSVLYGELYGGKVTAQSKQYTGTGQIGFRVFDAQILPSLDWAVEQTLEQLSTWRESNQQNWTSVDKLENCPSRLGLRLVPDLAVTDGEAFPKTIEDTAAWMQQLLMDSVAILDDQAGGQPEGVIVRTQDRSTIFKLRFEDYARTLKARK
jgi:hypothetical protein